MSLARFSGLRGAFVAALRSCLGALPAAPLAVISAGRSRFPSVPACSGLSRGSFPPRLSRSRSYELELSSSRASASLVSCRLVFVSLARGFLLRSRRVTPSGLRICARMLESLSREWPELSLATPAKRRGRGVRKRAYIGDWRGRSLAAGTRLRLKALLYPQTCA